MERLPRPVALVFPMKTDNPSSSSARGKARDYSIRDGRRPDRSAPANSWRAPPPRPHWSSARSPPPRRRAPRAPSSRRSFAAARAAAAAADRAVAAGRDPGPLAGLAVSIKDLFDVAGEITAAGSTILRDAPAAAADAPAVARLRRAGAAFDRPHPHVGVRLLRRRPQSALPGARQPGDARASTRRRASPGGSTSGGAASVADRRRLGRARLRHRRLDPHPGGAAGRRRLQEHGAAGADRRRRAALADARHRLGDDPLGSRRRRPARGPRRAARCSSPAAAAARSGASRSPTTAHARRPRRDRRARVRAQPRGALGGRRADRDDRARAARPRSPSINANGGFAAAESWAFHRRWLVEREAEYDPRVALRIRRGETMSAADYIDLVAARRDWIARMESALQGFDAAALADRADRRAAARAAGRRRRGVLRHQQPAAAQPEQRQLPRRLRPEPAVPRDDELPVGLMVWSTAPATTTPSSTPAWRSRPRSPAATVSRRD